MAAGLQRERAVLRCRQRGRLRRSRAERLDRYRRRLGRGGRARSSVSVTAAAAPQSLCAQAGQTLVSGAATGSSGVTGWGRGLAALDATAASPAVGPGAPVARM